MADSDSHNEESGGSGDEGGHEEGGQDSREEPSDITELASKSLRIQSKRYYVDVKENSRGRFIKVVEGLPNGQKSRINMPMALCQEFRNKLGHFHDVYNKLDPNRPELEEGADGKLHSDIIRGSGRRIYLDLKENKRGIYLRISAAGLLNNRVTIALPAQGIVEMRNTFTEFLEKFGTDEAQCELPESKEMRVERKRFYFDCGRNDRGSFLRVSEVTSNYRSSITIPKQGLAKFKTQLCEMIDKMEGGVKEEVKEEEER